MLLITVFSLLMVALPLTAFSWAWNGRLDGLLLSILSPKLLEEQRVVIAGTLAVAAVNLAVAAFVTAAWLEKPPPAARKED
ncbi:hypothetical protein D9Q98_001254 [Chlorella vulgaris]|uniref:Uncharacterized protein n=1 Tax=Chlorella vulgaris TaxID=3077 RepID=A0A9D4TZZ9_CHLVU|nr:hypothetical protein D9Q98_001254 [Chlorella vulgaris]